MDYFAYEQRQQYQKLGTEQPWETADQRKERKQRELARPNEYGVPLHACHGHRHDEHYWAWIRHRILVGEFGVSIRTEMLART